MIYSLIVKQEGCEDYLVSSRTSREDLEKLNFDVPIGLMELRVSTKDGVLPKIRLDPETEYSFVGNVLPIKGMSHFLNLRNHGEVTFNQVNPKLVIRCSAD